jgi:Putative beta-barrel porin-2, OmpL-like. bbp2/Carboxypeptidase regulatory-like domain
MTRPSFVSIAIPLWMALNLVSVQAQSPLGALHGVTVNADGAPIASAPVVIHRIDDNTERTIISGFDGAFSVADLKPGRYEVRASKEDLRSLSATVDLAARQDLKVDLALAPNTADGDISPAVAKKLEAMEAMEARMAARIEQLEAQLKTKTEAEQPATPALRGDLVASLTKDPSQIPIVPATLAKPDTSKAVASAAGSSASGQDAKGQPAPAAPAAPAVDLQTPFAFGDFTWLNGSPRNKDVVFDSPFFTPEVRFDTHYMEDFNQPIDHTIVGATESFRSGEVQIEQISVGGDFHWQNVRGRVLYMDGLFATTTPRNDASSATGTYPGNTGGVGQWDLQGAYKYVSEAYGGYHFNVNHGLNVDAGIFVSYIGLFSYYNFDNWTYQPSYVSSNTPWFFNGVRVQWFPTNKLKIEPWFINGWQSYAKYNGHPGLGGQLLWEPREWFKLVANQYGYGQDNLGLPHTERIHTDDSIEVRYYNKPESTGLSKMAFSLTGDAGAQYGGGLCGTCAPSQGKESFVGWMAYDRFWFHKDLLGLTLGGGEMSNWGRYLTLLPPIDGATAASGTPYFTELPGQRAHMWDSTITLQYMPKQYITWWAEAGYRHSDVPYFAGRGGVTPPGGNNGLPQYYTCMNGATSGTGTLVAAQTACGGAGNVWFPDLRRSETKVSVGVMVKF